MTAERRRAFQWIALAGCLVVVLASLARVVTGSLNAFDVLIAVWFAGVGVYMALGLQRGDRRP